MKPSEVDLWATEQASRSSPSELSDTREQQRGLLGNDDRPARDAEKLSDYEATPRKLSCLPLRAIALCIATIALSALVLSQLLSATKSAPYPGNTSNLTAPDYTLSPAWDYSTPPTTRSYNLTLAPSTFSPDGISRPMLLLNNQFPGPLIEANVGDTLRITLNNHSPNATSLHWHGLFQNGTAHMDGTVGVTQCPIAPGASFTYEFKVERQYGTYWYHSHQGVQAADGVFGPLVVHSVEERELMGGWDSDRVVMVSDHYHETSSALLMDYLKSDAENAEPVPDGALINGRGMRDCGRFKHRECDTNGMAWPRFELEKGKRHRLRIISAGAFAEFQVSVDEQSLEVVEVDGTVVKPVSFERLNINPAQRYSVILGAEEKALDSAWLRAKMLKGCFTDPPKWIETDTLAVFSYTDGTSSPTKDADPTSKDYGTGPDLECRDLDTSALSPLPSIPAPANADATFFLRSNFEIGAYRLSRGFFNRSSFRPNLQSPTLHRAIKGLSSRNRSSFPDGIQPGQSSHAFINDAAFHQDRELVIQTTGIQVIDLVVSNFDDGNHPLHLHGYKFWELGRGNGYPPEDFLDTVDLSNPLRRDTSSVEAFGWTWLRLLADNPGVWALHCHISWHSEAGLLMQLITRADGLKGLELPEENRKLCEVELGELRKGAVPDDEVFMIG